MDATLFLQQERQNLTEKIKTFAAKEMFIFSKDKTSESMAFAYSYYLTFQPTLTISTPYLYPKPYYPLPLYTQPYTRIQDFP